MNAFDFSDYRLFIRSKVESSDRGGHGQYRKIADFLGIPSSLLSQVMSSRRELSMESASLICEYFGLRELEAEYFITLIEFERAGNESLRARKKAKLDVLRRSGMQLEERISHEKKLSETQKAIFYSQWFYSGIRLISSIEGRNNIESMSEMLKLPRSVVAQAVSFLIETGLCVEQNGQIRIGPMSTHVGNDSAMVVRHHLNWRLKIMNQLATPRDHELAFTGPAVISHEACVEIKKKILMLIDDWGHEVDQAKEQKLVCLNVDWFEIT